ncbi:hypothetical protein DUNSADRAFT_17616 [Dunaliella salina]|uniref:Encoded protein n=1 Tax=Dunaliella salina TaxID=3046 RepID=A0ABQ7G1G2_DUNSA|nr:hypothetical protein DUNSADRAFT_17616 [Dunaliella salina]|eukprot:KAF5828437.1 hypothetical protein DUNSADRAFT_17616 [Dunaliella salina]
MAQVLLQAGARERVIGTATSVPAPSHPRAPIQSHLTTSSAAPPHSGAPASSEFEVEQASSGAQESCGTEGSMPLNPLQAGEAAAPTVVGFQRGRGRGLAAPSPGEPASPGSC